MGNSQFLNAESQLGNLRVLTINLEGRNGAWPARRNVLIDGLRTLKTDLVAFQESICNEEYDQAIDLLGSDFHVVHQKSRDPHGMGISIASRWQFRELHEVGLHVTPRTKDFPCGAPVAEVLVPPPIGPLLFVNHFPNWQLNFEYERELQAVVAAQFVEDLIDKSNRQVILVGDFDADPEAASIRFWAGRQSLQSLSVCYRDAWESTHPKETGHTFTPQNPLVKDQVIKGGQPFRDWPFRRIDYIFVRYGAHGSQALDVKYCDRIFDKPINDVQASDHYGLVADLAVPIINVNGFFQPLKD